MTRLEARCCGGLAARREVDAMPGITATTPPPPHTLSCREHTHTYRGCTSTCTPAKRLGFAALRPLAAAVYGNSSCDKNDSSKPRLPRSNRPAGQHPVCGPAVRNVTMCHHVHDVSKWPQRNPKVANKKGLEGPSWTQQGHRMTNSTLIAWLCHNQHLAPHPESFALHCTAGLLHRHIA